MWLTLVFVLLILLVQVVGIFMTVFYERDMDDSNFWLGILGYAVLMGALLLVKLRPEPFIAMLREIGESAMYGLVEFAFLSTLVRMLFLQLIMHIPQKKRTWLFIGLLTVFWTAFLIMRGAAL